VTKRLRDACSGIWRALLALRFLYGKAVQEGNIKHEDEVTVTVEEVAQAMAGTLVFSCAIQSLNSDSLRELRHASHPASPRGIARRRPDSFIASSRSILSLVNEGILSPCWPSMQWRPPQPKNLTKASLWVRGGED